jgi:hypothetical protein
MTRSLSFSIVLPQEHASMEWLELSIRFVGHGENAIGANIFAECNIHI